MRLESLPSSSSYTDEDERNLKQLLEAFSSVVSLKDIASAYCETGRDLNSTAERLCSLQGSHSGTSSQISPDNVKNVSGSSSGCASNDIQVNALKPKKIPASVGSVSDVIGRDYFRPQTPSDRQNQKLKPLKLNSDEFPSSEMWHEKNESASSSRGQSMDIDIQEFICKILGDGFLLEKSVIHEVIGKCGYNIPMSIDKLIDLSAANLEKSDDVIGITYVNTKKHTLGLGSRSSRTRVPVISLSGRTSSDVRRADEVVLSQAGTKKKDVQREVLEALFTAPNRVEEEVSTSPVRRIRRSAHGQVVFKPPEEKLYEDFTYITRQPINDSHDEAEMTWEELREAVAEYWVLMKEYYKSSVEAYIRKDYEKAQKLLEEGNFYMRKAHEADEQSAKKLSGNSDEEEDFNLNMHYLEPKDALQNMKLHLTSLSGLPSIRYLKAVVGTDGRGKKDGRRKHLITKLLEKEGIPFTEEGNGWIISVRIDEIDPRALSFSSK